MVQHPEVLWAQRSSDSDAEKNILYLTVNLPDIIESSLEYDLASTKISFKAKAGVDAKEYAFDLEFFGEVVPEKSKKKLSSRSLSLIIQKKDLKSEYWSRLTKEKVKNAFLKTDFSKWVDEDEQDGSGDTAVPEDFDMGMGGGMGGMPGMDGMGMGGMGGMGGGMDFEKMMKEMGNMGGPEGMEALSGGSGGQNDDLDDSDDDGPPPLEDAEPPK